jgi:hypothetical protein
VHRRGVAEQRAEGKDFLPCEPIRRTELGTKNLELVVDLDARRRRGQEPGDFARVSALTERRSSGASCASLTKVTVAMAMSPDRSRVTGSSRRRSVR